MLIGITQPSGKLVFVASLQVSCHCETSAHTGRGNPPVEWNQVAITTKNRRSSHFLGAIRYISPLTGGLPHQSADWFAMTAFFECAFSNNNIGYRLRTASMETPHVTTVGAAISRPKGLNHCAFPAKRGALEAVRFRAADSRPYGGIPAITCWMVCCFNPNLIQHYSASIRPAGRFCDWTRNCSRILPLILFISLLFLRKGRLPLYRAVERFDPQWQANTDWDRRTWHIDIPTQDSMMGDRYPFSHLVKLGIRIKDIAPSPK